MSNKVKIIEIQGLPHTLTQSNGETFRIFPKQTKVIDEKLVSAEFHNEERTNNILIVPVENEVTKNPKGGKK